MQCPQGTSYPEATASQGQSTSRFPPQTLYFAAKCPGTDYLQLICLSEATILGAIYFVTTKTETLPVPSLKFSIVCYMLISGDILVETKQRTHLMLQHVKDYGNKLLVKKSSEFSILTTSSLLYLIRIKSRMQIEFSKRKVTSHHITKVHYYKLNLL